MLLYGSEPPRYIRAITEYRRTTEFLFLDPLRDESEKYLLIIDGLDELKLEGFNNKIKVAKRIGYGYRDDGYFFTLIRYLALPLAWLESHNFP